MLRKFNHSPKTTQPGFQRRSALLPQGFIHSRLVNKYVSNSCASPSILQARAGDRALIGTNAPIPYLG